MPTKPRHTVHPTTGELLKTSPSAIELFLKCETAWWLRYVVHAEERIDPKIRKAQDAGTAAHQQLEAYLLRGCRVTDHFGSALLKYAPAPRTEGLLVETNTFPVLYIADIPIDGRIDWTLDDLVSDWKTRSDLDRFQKSEEQLRLDVQMNIYAAWLFECHPELSTVRVAHLYAETKRHRDRDSNVVCLRCGSLTACEHVPRTDKVEIVFRRDEVNSYIRERIEPALDRMRAVAMLRTAQECGHPEDLESRASPCRAYGNPRNINCGYCHACPHQQARLAEGERGNWNFSAVFNQGDETMSSLQELIAKRKQAAQTATPEPAPAAPAQQPAPSAPPAATEPAKASIIGEVTGPNGPVAKARVHVEGNPIVVTDAGGKFEFPNSLLVGAQVAVSCNADGLAATAVTHTVTAGINRVQFQLVPETGAEKPTPGGIVREDYDQPKKRGRKPKAETAPASAQPAPVQAAPAPATFEEPEQVIDAACATAPRILREALAEVEKKQAVNGCILSVDGAVSGPLAPAFRDLAPYVRELCAELVKRDGREGGIDPRWVKTKDSPLAYGGWKGALTELIRAKPPEGSLWRLLTLGDEVMQVAAAALASLPGVTVIAK